LWETRSNLLRRRNCLHLGRDLWEDGKNAVVSVRDSGIGIPKDQLASVFERFYQVKGADNGKGNGIGWTGHHQRTGRGSSRNDLGRKRGGKRQPVHFHFAHFKGTVMIRRGNLRRTSVSSSLYLQSRHRKSPIAPVRTLTNLSIEWDRKDSGFWLKSPDFIGRSFH